MAKGSGIFITFPRAWWALALSVAGHASLAYVFSIEVGWIAGPAAGMLAAEPSLIVELVKPEGHASASSHLSPEYAWPDKNGPTASTELLRAAMHGPDAYFSMWTPTAPYYFQIDELTEKPRVLHDIAPVLSLGLPDAVSQSLVLRLLINELGGIDEVVIEDSHLPASVQQLVKDALVKITFESGKIDNIPVKSQLKIEVTLEATGQS